MAKTIEQLKAQGAQVKNATVVGENTATRVGTLFTDIVEHVEQYETGQTAETEANTLAISNEAQARAKADEGLNAAIVAEKERAEAAERDNAQGIIYDVSSHNNDEVFESLQALLSSSNLGMLIPTSVRHGGMSIRFIQGSEQSSDHNYVGYFCKADSFSTDYSDWEKINNVSISYNTTTEHIDITEGDKRTPVPSVWEVNPIVNKTRKISAVDITTEKDNIEITDNYGNVHGTISIGDTETVKDYILIKSETNDNILELNKDVLKVNSIEFFDGTPSGIDRCFINLSKLVHEKFYDMPAFDENKGGYANFLLYFYSLYDRLMTDYPDYITRENLDQISGIIGAGYDTSTMPMYGYKFSYKGNAYSQARQARPIRIMAVTATHPYAERASVFVLFKTMELICEGWKDNDLAEIRQGVEFYVIPCSCPWGVANDSFLNINNVNLNRNCGTDDWVYNAAQNTGATADSEYETKVFEWAVRRFKPQAFLDLHNFNYNENPGNVAGCIFRPLGCTSNFAKEITATCKQETLRCMAKYSDIAQNPDLYLADYESYPTSAGGGQRAYWVNQKMGVEFSTNTEIRPVFGWSNGKIIDYSLTTYGDAKAISIGVDLYINMIISAIFYITNK